MSKTIGVLGGMGPYATLDFMRLILDLTGAKKESDNFRVVVDSNPRIPSRTRAYLYCEEDPVPMMKEAVRQLVLAGADFIVVPCNSAHYFLPRVFEGGAVPFIDMIEATSQVIVRRGWSKIGILAGEVTVGARLYEDHLDAHGVEVIQLCAEDQRLVREVIEDVKSGAITAQTEVTMMGLFEILRSHGALAVVLACTELQAVVRNLNTDIPILDSLEILAREAIALARVECNREASQ